MNLVFAGLLVVVGVVCENCIVDASICARDACFFVCVVCAVIFFFCVYFVVCCKGTWWMPWHAKPMKDVEGCVMPRGVVNQALIRGCPNGETRLWLFAVTC